MKKYNYNKTYLITMILIGFLASGFAGYYFGISKKDRIASDSKIASDNLTPGEKNLYDGSSLTLPEMLNSLQGASGSDFDHKLLVYEIAIKQNETGMLRIAKEKSEKDLAKKYADTQIEQNETVTDLLYKWQQSWGLSHH